MTPVPRSKRQQALRWFAATFFAIAAAAAMTPAGLGFFVMWGTTRPPCSPGPTPDQFGLTAEDVSIPSRLGVSFRGYFFRGTNGATIILTPAYGQDRGGWLREGAILVRNGYSLLSFDSRPCAGITPHSLGYWEANDIFDAIEYLRSRGDVNMTRVGAHGFSQAGASNLFAAAQSPDLRAVTAEGGYVDYAGQALGIGQPGNAAETLFRFGSELGYRLSTGLDIHVLRPVDVIAAIAPRRVLLIYGTAEPMTPGARQAAFRQEHVEFWEVSGATHGSYLDSAGEEEFTRRVVGFFDAALAPVDSGS